MNDNIARYNERRRLAREALAEENARLAAESLAADQAHARKAWDELNDNFDDFDYDGPEVIMLSTGYAEVCLDGDVVSSGRVLFNVAH